MADLTTTAGAQDLLIVAKIVDKRRDKDKGVEYYVKYLGVNGDYAYVWQTPNALVTAEGRKAIVEYEGVRSHL